MPRPSWRMWLAGGLAVVVVGVLLIARLSGSDGDGGPSRSGGTSPAGASASATLPDDSLVGSPTPEIDPELAIVVVLDFVREWGRHLDGESVEQWVARTTPYVTPDFADQLRLAAPEQLEPVAVTGDASVRTSSPTSVVVAVPSRAGRLLVTCVLVEGAWKVGDLTVEPGSSRSP